ncbi:hypothetical protein D1007_08021 [Hordeum vulgare]|uniref:Uncharacterized protein n=2 Tax=Hordeum vulgare subsp. vulgare TaxID=112509 RepID=A0A8I6XZD1_HORVV|nr:uncharacterized protein LOC123395986 [Hordeum vulgare subsp. vulgare]KAE8814510.1 hypothetical protein D1007_08021 [Hordeum vulgare]KAI4991982.1 hypothetical protein ZWY2020_040368 [Hordeum vulgare]
MAAARDLAGNQPGSTRACIGEDVAWSDVTGVYDRDNSLKENTNPKCFIVKNYPGHRHRAGNGAAQRFSGNLKPTAAPIIGTSGYLGQGQGCARRHRPPAMFPKNAKTGGGGRNPKPAVPEPGSPKVSCIGKVLSGRERDRRPELISQEKMRGGCCPWFGFTIRRSRSRKSAVESVDWSPPPRLPLAYVERKVEAKEVNTDQAPPPALAGMRRFASGRRVADWAAGTEEDGRLARSGPL